jgi:ABC-type Fe3+-siderophore transport system permease subunit
VTTTLKVTAAEARLETVTSHLRFIQRDKSRVLQQLVTWVSESGPGQEWRDVPLVSER